MRIHCHIFECLDCSEGEGIFEEDIFQKIDIIEPLVKDETYQVRSEKLWGHSVIT